MKFTENVIRFRYEVNIQAAPATGTFFSLFQSLIVSWNTQRRSWPEFFCCRSCLQLFWPRVLVRKLLNLSTKDSDFSADTEDEEDLDVDTDSDNEGGLSIIITASVYALSFQISQYDSGNLVQI